MCYHLKWIAFCQCFDVGDCEPTLFRSSPKPPNFSQVGYHDFGMFTNQNFTSPLKKHWTKCDVCTSNMHKKKSWNICFHKTLVVHLGANFPKVVFGQGINVPSFGVGFTTFYKLWQPIRSMIKFKSFASIGFLPHYFFKYSFSHNCWIYWSLLALWAHVLVHILVNIAYE